MSNESHSPRPSPDGVVCPKCLSWNTATAAFCADCGAPIGMVANIDPMQSIRAEGFGYRSAVDGPPKRIVLIGMWLMFVFLTASAVGMIFAHRGGLLSMIPFFILVMCLAAVVYRVTRNYIVKSRLAGNRDARA